MTCGTAQTSESVRTARSAASDACPACAKAAANPLSGGYRMQCLACCTRLVLSAHPNKPQAAAMLAAIARFPDAPGREQILESVRLELTKRR